MTKEEITPKEEVAYGGPVEGQAETATTDEQETTSDEPYADATVGWCKRHSRCVKWFFAVLCVAAVAFAVVAVAVTLSIGNDDDAETFPYRDMVEELELSPESRDEDIVQAVNVMNEHFSQKCKAGWAVAVIRNGKRLVVPQGVLRIGEAERVNADTLFEIGSISKPITGLVLAQHIVAGLVTLETPLNDRLPDSIPDLVVNGELVTFGQLVTHTAGFPRLSRNVRDRSWDWFKDNPYGGYSEEDMLREISIAADELSQSGKLEYSNFGFSILAYLLSKNANETFPVLQKSLTEQLSMNNTWIESLPETARVRLSTGYSGSSPTPYWFDGGYFINGAGSSLCSVNDLCRLVEVLVAPDMLAGVSDGENDLVEALKLSLTPLHTTSSTNGVGFSWFYGHPNETDLMETSFSHTGGTAGFAAFASFQPRSQMGVVAMTNCGDRGRALVSMGTALASKLL